jgi:hypothetical protein
LLPTVLNRKIIVSSVVLLLLTALGLWATDEASSDDSSTPGGAIINRYLQAAQTDQSSTKSQPVEVDIDATVPSLNEHGRLRALRKISAVGKITYRVLGFQGDNNIKNQVIARYLQAEQQNQGNSSLLALTRANYKFKLRGQRPAFDGRQVYVFQVSPRAKRVGLFKGELWLDTKTYLPVMEKGRLVKNPSIFFRKVDFERDFSIQEGASVPARMSSTIDTRIVGKVNLNVAYSAPASDLIDTESSSDSSTPSNADVSNLP